MEVSYDTLHATRSEEIWAGGGGADPGTNSHRNTAFCNASPFISHRSQLSPSAAQGEHTLQRPLDKAVLAARDTSVRGKSRHVNITIIKLFSAARLA